MAKEFQMNQGAHVRMAQWDDAAVLAVLSYEFNHVQVTSDHVLSRLSSGFHTEIVVVGEVDGQVVGFACAQVLESICYAKPWAELVELYVQERYRRRGVGRGLVRMVEQMVQREGATDLLVHTNTMNTASQALYQSMGYEIAVARLAAERIDSPLNKRFTRSLMEMPCLPSVASTAKETHCT